MPRSVVPGGRTGDYDKAADPLLILYTFLSAPFELYISLFMKVSQAGRDSPGPQEGHPLASVSRSSPGHLISMEDVSSQGEGQ